MGVSETGRELSLCSAVPWEWQYDSQRAECWALQWVQWVQATLWDGPTLDVRQATATVVVQAFLGAEGVGGSHQLLGMDGTG